MFGLHDFRNKFFHSIVLLVIGLFFFVFFFSFDMAIIICNIENQMVIIETETDFGTHNLLTRSYQMCPIIYFVLCFSILLSELNF